MMARGAKTKPQAEKVVVKWFMGMESGRSVEPSKISLNKYYKEWLESKKREGLALQRLEVTKYISIRTLNRI